MTDYTKLMDEFPEINPANYGDDEVNALNAWGIAAHTAIEALQAENERLSAGWNQANQEALQAKLTVQEQAKDIVLLCDDLKYIAGIARRAGMPVDDDNLKVRAAILGAFKILEAERDALQAKLEAPKALARVALRLTLK